MMMILEMGDTSNYVFLTVNKIFFLVKLFSVMNFPVSGVSLGEKISLIIIVIYIAG